MNNADYFFFIFLGTIVTARLLTLNPRMAAPTIRGFRVRHYMYGILLIIFSFFVPNPVVYAIGLGLLLDEAPVIIVKGTGYREEKWRGMQDYHTPWSFAGVLIIILLVFLFRSNILGFIYK